MPALLHALGPCVGASVITGTWPRYWCKRDYKHLAPALVQALLQAVGPSVGALLQAPGVEAMLGVKCGLLGMFPMTDTPKGREGSPVMPSTQQAWPQPWPQPSRTSCAWLKALHFLVGRRVDGHHHGMVQGVFCGRVGDTGPWPERSA